MEWRVEVLNDTVRSELDALPLVVRARLIRLERLISQVGLEALREPYVKPGAPCLAFETWEASQSHEHQNRYRKATCISRGGTALTVSPNLRLDRLTFRSLHCRRRVVCLKSNFLRHSPRIGTQARHVHMAAPSRPPKVAVPLAC